MAAARAIITGIDQDIEQQLGPRTHAQLRAILEDKITTRTAPASRDGSRRRQQSRRST
jgi:hypothetical protein